MTEGANAATSKRQRPLSISRCQRSLVFCTATILATGALLAAPLIAPPLAAQQQPGTATLDEITENPAHYFGRQVTVTGEVGEILGPRSFTITDDDVFFGGEIPVVGAQQIMDQNGRQVDLNQWADREVRVTGTVHQFNVRAFEDQLGIDLDDTAWAGYAGQAAIIAASVTPMMAGQQGMQSGQQPGAAAPVMTPGQQDMQQGRDQQGNATVDAILDNPSQYYGRQVTVTGDVNVLGPGALRLIGEDALAPEELLIVSRDQAATRNLTDANNIRATGTIRRFVVAEVEREFGIDWDDTILVEFEGKPAMIASSITQIEGELGRVDAPDVNAPNINVPNVGVPNVGAEVEQRGVTVDAILDNPSQHYGQRVTITGNIGEILGPRSFTIEDDDLLFDEDIAVVGAQQIVDQNGRPVDLNQWADREVRVTGTVHQFNVRAFEDRLGLDLDDNAWTDYAGRPVIIADSVSEVTRTDSNR